MRNKARLIATVLSGGANPYPTTGLIAYWKLDETSDGSAPVQRNDSVGSLHLTDTNTVPSVAGKISNAASFTTANSERLESASTTVIGAGAGVSFECAFWVQRAANANMSIVGKGSAWAFEYSADGAFRLLCRKADNSATVLMWANAIGTPALNTWYFINLWHDAAANQIGVRINDAYENVDNTYSFDVYSVSSPFYIGYHNFTGYHTGRVDEVGFWQRVLTPAERTYLYNAGAGRSLP